MLPTANGPGKMIGPQQCHVALSALTNVDIAAANANRCKMTICLYLLKHHLAFIAPMRRLGATATRLVSVPSLLLVTHQT